MPARTPLTILLLAAALVAAPAAASASGSDVIADCVAGQLKAHYPSSDYADALAHLPADVAEYSGCAGEIAAARTRDLSATSLAVAARAKAARAASASASAVGENGHVAANALSPDFDAVTTPAAATTPAPTTAPQSTPSVNAGPGDGTLAALTIGTGSDGDGPAATGGGLPVIPIVIALSVIALSAARALTVWSDRPERTDAATDSA